MIEEGFDPPSGAIQPTDASLIGAQAGRVVIASSSARRPISSGTARRSGWRICNGTTACASRSIRSATTGSASAGEYRMSVKVSGNLISNNAPVLRAAALDGQGYRAGRRRPSSAWPISPDGLVVSLLPKAIVRSTSRSMLNFPTRHHLSTKVRAFLDLAAAHFARHRAALEIRTEGAVQRERHVMREPRREQRPGREVARVEADDVGALRSASNTRVTITPSSSAPRRCGNEERLAGIAVGPEIVPRHGAGLEIDAARAAAAGPSRGRPDCRRYRRSGGACRHRPD